MKWRRAQTSTSITKFQLREVPLLSKRQLIESIPELAAPFIHGIGIKPIKLWLLVSSHHQPHKATSFSIYLHPPDLHHQSASKPKYSRPPKTHAHTHTGSYQKSKEKQKVEEEEEEEDTQSAESLSSQTVMYVCVCVRERERERENL